MAGGGSNVRTRSKLGRDVQVAFSTGGAGTGGGGGGGGGGKGGRAKFPLEHLNIFSFVCVEGGGGGGKCRFFFKETSTTPGRATS